MAAAGNGGQAAEEPGADREFVEAPAEPPPADTPARPRTNRTPRRLKPRRIKPRRGRPAAAAGVPAAPEPEVPEPGATGPGATGADAADAARPAAEETEVVRPIRPTPLWSKICIALGALLVLLSSGTIVTVKVLSARYENAVSREQLLAPDARERTTPAQTSTITGPLNYLLIGSDYRNRNPSEGQRADTIIVVHVPATLDKAYLISIPRDLLVEIPAFEPTSFGGDETKINAAYQYGGGGRGGTQLLSATLSRLLGIRFNGAAIVNFEGFRKAVDVLGGVYMCVDRTVSSNHLGVDPTGKILELYADEEGRIQDVPPGGHAYVFEQGCRRMDGRLALDYARIRYGLPAGDYDRQHHQQQFLKAIFAEALRDGIVTNPLRFDQFLQAVGSTLTVDTGETGLADLIFGLRNVTPSTFTGVKVPSYPQSIDGVSYILPEELATSLYRAIREDAMDAWVAANPRWVNDL